MNIDEIILLKEKEIKQLKKQKYREENKTEIEKNIQLSKLEKDLIKDDFEKHTKEKVFEYFSFKCNKIFKFCTILTWDEDRKQFFIWTPVLHKKPVPINKDFGKHKIIQVLKDSEEKFERFNKYYPHLVKKYIAQVLVREELPEGFEILNSNCEYRPDLEIAYRGMSFTVSFDTKGKNTNSSELEYFCFKVQFKSFLDIDYKYKQLGKYFYILNWKDKIVKTGNDPIYLIQEIAEDIETLVNLFQQYS